MGALCAETYSLDQCSHSLTHSANPAFSVHYHTRARCVSRGSFLSFIHRGEGCCSHFLLLLRLPSLTPEQLTLVFPPRCSVLGVVVDDINRATLLLTFHTDWRGVARGHAHHDGEEREGVFFSLLLLLLLSDLKQDINKLSTLPRTPHLPGLRFRFEGFYCTGALKD